MGEFEHVGDDEAWDQAFADDLVGCSLLVGLTFVDQDDEVLRREQHFGIVVSVDPVEGIVIREDDGDEVTIAPVLEAIEAGAPGRYHLRESGRDIEDPDFTAMLVVRAPVRH